jgi:hypothetical protein
MVDSVTLVMLGLPATARQAVERAVSGRRAVAEATLIVAGAADDRRIASEIRSTRALRPGDRVVVVVEAAEVGPGGLAEALADGVVRLHPGCGRRPSDTALAAGRIAGVLTGLGILAPAARPVARPLLGPLAARWGRKPPAPGLAPG